jgi:hypothetical protein
MSIFCEGSNNNSGYFVPYKVSFKHRHLKIGGYVPTMEPITLYGYVPTHWIAILFVVSCIVTLSTAIPAMFFKYKNCPLGTLIVMGTLSQLVGHVCMGVSSFQPTNIAPWGVQLFAFQLGKAFARFAALDTYHKCFIRVRQTESSGNSKTACTDDWFLEGLASIAGLCFGYRYFYDICQLINMWDYSPGQSTSMPPAFHIMLISLDFLLLTTTLCLLLRLVFIVVRTRKQTPWFRLTWMTGYYSILLIIPGILVIQDVYGIVRCFVSYRNEMLELFGDMGMTKSVLMLLSFQYYELTYAWSQERPKFMEKIELQVMRAFKIKVGEPQEEQESDSPHEV